VLRTFRLTRGRRVDFCHSFSYASAFLRDRITPTAAVAAVRSRLSSHANMFLEIAERAIFAQPGSPYRPLLEPPHADDPSCIRESAQSMRML